MLLKEVHPLPRHAKKRHDFHGSRRSVVHKEHTQFKIKRNKIVF